MKKMAYAHTNLGILNANLIGLKLINIYLLKRYATGKDVFAK